MEAVDYDDNEGIQSGAVDLMARAAPSAAPAEDAAALLDDRLTLQVRWWGKAFKEPFRWYDGVFVFRRQTIGDSADIAVKTANLTGGAAWESIPPADRTLLVATALCMQLLEVKPDWFRLDGKDQGVVQPALLIELLGAYQKWSEGFFRTPPAAGAGEKRPPVVEVRPVVGRGAR